MPIATEFQIVSKVALIPMAMVKATGAIQILTMMVSKMILKQEVPQQRRLILMVMVNRIIWIWIQMLMVFLIL